MSRHNKSKEERKAEKIDRLTRYKEMLNELRKKESQLRFEGNNLQADYLFKNQIRPLWKQIERENRGKAQPLLELAREAGYDPRELIHLIVKVHLTADYITELIGRMEDELEKIGADKCNFFTVTDEAFKQWQFLASMMAGEKYGILKEAIVDNGEYLRDMDKLNEDYLKSRGATPEQWRKAQEQAIEERGDKPIERDY